MRFPSECYKYVLLSLDKKEAPLAYHKTEYRKAENPSRTRVRKKTESGKCQVDAIRVGGWDTKVQSPFI